MNSHDLTRLLIEGAVGRALKQVQKDPHRSLRNLVDLGLTFSNVQLQRRFLQLARNMLEQEDSAYYELLDLLVQKVDHENLKTFGVNVGYEGLTRGAKAIRNLEETYHIPWTLMLELDQMDRARELVRQGKELGIYVYNIISDQVGLVALRELLEEEPYCAFCLLTTGENLLRQGLEPLEGARNLYISILADEPGLEAAEALGAGGFLYGIHVRYDDPACIATERLERYLDYHPAGVALLPRDQAARDRSRDLYGQVKALRFQQKYPYILVDLVGDGLYVDSLISGEAGLLVVHGDGGVLTVDGQGIQNTGDLQQKPLAELLRAVLPKDRPAPEGRA